MKFKFSFLVSILFGVFAFFLYRTISITYGMHDYYMDRYKEISEVYISGGSAPRGRILDINGKVIVDNKGVNTILYHKPNDINEAKEVEIAKKLVELTNYEYPYKNSDLINYYMIIRKDITDGLITLEEKKLYSERKLSSDDIEEIKKNRITEDMINELTEQEKYSSYFYNLMNDGYRYDNKILLRDISEELYASILESGLSGVFGEIDWSRNYIYGDTLKSALGSISNNLPSEKKDLLTKGYSYNDKVGISGLEEYYEEYLRGDKAIYKVNNNNLELVSEAKRGNDLVLEIDIDMEMKVIEIIKEQILKAKKLPNTEYYRESYALISEPKTGAVRVLAGVRLLDNGEFQDVSINVIKNAYTVGSAVKAASITVGYQEKVVDIGSTMTDGCVKLKNIPAKCSYKRLGRLDDLRALQLSSNYYQFVVALGVAGYKYSYNMEAPVTEEDFLKYRATFEKYGLGTTTGIDLPGESVGLRGDKVAPDLLMNLAIGQYDLYTPTSLLQYINTIANKGERLKLNLMNRIGSEEPVLQNGVQVLSTVNLEDKYMTRIQDALHEVVRSGTGYGYIDPSIPAAGKTGTSESYIDTNNDGAMDAFVLSNTFIMYAPIEEPKYSMVVISPNTSNLNGKSRFRAGVNRNIARNINNLLFSTG